MKTLYLDIFSGISGDMFIGAMIDLGLKPSRLEEELEKLKLKGWHIHVGRGMKFQISGTKFDVHLHHDHKHGHSHHPHDDHDHGHQHSHGHEHGRNHADIRKLILRSKLSAWVKEKSLNVFQRIAVAEGKIHGVKPEKVHFHEVGAVDSIIDIVGACVALDLMGRPRVLASPVVEGMGWIRCAHGRFPIPAPATLEILGARRIAVTQSDEPHELVTPTGAALLAEFVEHFGPMQGLAAQKIGFGVGTRDNVTRPNVLRAVLGETEGGASGNDWETDTVALLETNLDDVSAEVLGHFVETALAAGALDVFYTPIQMKKNRPGVLLSVLCEAGEADKFAELILSETSAFGVRRSLMERRKLKREFVKVKTRHGEVIMKLGRLNGRIVQAAPEYESCKAVADEKGVPLKAVFDAAIKAVKY